MKKKPKYPKDCPYWEEGNKCSCKFSRKRGCDMKMGPKEERDECIGLPSCAVYGTPPGGFRR